jgi:hypothetical protein
MAKIALGPTGREILNIEIGEPRAGNTPGNNTPVGARPPVDANDAEGPDFDGRTRNDGQVELGDRNGHKEGEYDNGRPRERGPAAGNGTTEEPPPYEKGLPKINQQGEQPAYEKGLPKINQQDTDWPILTETFPRRWPSHETDTPEATRRKDEDRDHHWQESYNANRTSLRRGLIRDYLQQNLQETLFETRAGTNSPIDLQRLTQTVADRLSRTYNDPAILTDKTLNLITKEISHLLGKDLKVNTGNPTIIPYERASQIANLLLRHISKEVNPGLLHLTDQKILDALILLQLCCQPGRHIDEMRQITGHKPCILPDGIRWSAFRDAGLLAASLMGEGASLRTASLLDAAVQRFVKRLVANNELGILLAAARLAADARAGRLSNGSLVALVRIYELIAQLMILTERLMKEASEAAARKPAELTRMDKGLAFAGALESNEAESALRQYLAFNPTAQADSGASAFFSEQLAETSARIAVDSSQREMVEWLNSGRHRFVTEVDLGQPLGIIIDRASDECFMASQIRVILVRDGSVLGWHILRSSLVR